MLHRVNLNNVKVGLPEVMRRHDGIGLLGITNYIYRPLAPAPPAGHKLRSGSTPASKQMYRPMLKNTLIRVRDVIFQIGYAFVRQKPSLVLSAQL